MPNAVMPETTKYFINEMARVRVRRNLTQGQVAIKMNSTPMIVCRIENGQGNPSLDRVMQYCLAATGKPLHKFMAENLGLT